MTTGIDPEGLELEILHGLVDFQDKDVLEIGCGDGRMTLRFAEHTRSVAAFDLDEAPIQTAREQLPEPLRSKVTFEVAGMGDVELPSAGYDVAVLSRSL